MKLLPVSEQQAWYEQVWNLARQVPEGEVATYGQLAHMLAPPLGCSAEDYKAYSPRWAGDAMSACPVDVPWHRIINSQGKISHRLDAEKQRQMLEAEGLQFVNERIDLNQHQWESADKAKAPKQGTLF